MLKKNLIGVVIVLVVFAGFYAAYLFGKNSAQPPAMQQQRGMRQRPQGSSPEQGGQAPALRQQNTPQQAPAESRESAPHEGVETRLVKQRGQTPEKAMSSAALVADKAVAAPPEKAASPAASVTDKAVAPLVTPAAQQDTFEMQTFYGTVVAYAEMNVQSEQGGKITFLKGREGDAIQKGEVIVRFDSRDTELELQQAISSKNSADQSVQEAESNFKTVQANVDRYQKLFDDGFISKQELDENLNKLEAARSALNSARESVKRTEADVNLIKNTLTDFQLRSSMNGIIDVKNYNLHEVYKASDVIYHLVDIDQVYVEIDVPETYIGQIQKNMAVNVVFDALNSVTFPAVIETILPSGTAENRTFIVKAVLNNPDHLVKPGMFARVNVTLGERPVEFQAARETIAYQQDER